MPDLAYRQQKIQEKRKQTSFRDFVKEILSWYPLVLNKRGSLISLYPDEKRSCPIIPHAIFLGEIDTLTKHGKEYDTQLSFFENFKALFLSVPFSSLYNYTGAENSDYAFSVFQSKNCYLSFAVITDCENVLYSFAVKE